MSSLDDDLLTTLSELTRAGVEFIVVGMSAAVLQGAPVVTFDLDLVHRRTSENVERLLGWLQARAAYHRFDLANRRLPPTHEQLSGTGHVNLTTSLGALDLLCELSVGEGFEELERDAIAIPLGTAAVRVLGLARLIEVKARANRPKDRAALPVLLATLDEQKRSPR